MNKHILFSNIHSILGKQVQKHIILVQNGEDYVWYINTWVSVTDLSKSPDIQKSELYGMKIMPEYVGKLWRYSVRKKCKFGFVPFRPGSFLLKGVSINISQKKKKTTAVLHALCLLILEYFKDVEKGRYLYSF